ncbi:Genomic scaffold, pathogen EMU scaffold 006484 [Echinococcus multilocularis]|uniref:Genomic scaffold, pathogen EMU scaffold 006484 n=1 Tax=Echinococcus multilocularis TaxID=6211 RepID=A0A0S4MK13_ECHMU|nr:Genomic scaffold, pathogen EMU scaffold 006484 [Echinococcus multilocularis]
MLGTCAVEQLRETSIPSTRCPVDRSFNVDVGVGVCVDLLRVQLLGPSIVSISHDSFHVISPHSHPRNSPRAPPPLFTPFSILPFSSFLKQRFALLPLFLLSASLSLALFTPPSSHPLPSGISSIP